MQTRFLGNDAVGRTEIGVIGLGCMPFDQRGDKPRDQLLETVSTAVEAGVVLVDTADAYGPAGELGEQAMGANERLVASLLDELGLRDRVLVATKAGHVRTADGGWALDGSPSHLERAVDASRERLGVDVIDLWQHHRPDPDVPYEQTLEALKRVHDSGKVRMLGLSNADTDQIVLAKQVLGDALVSVQNEFSPAFRTSRPEIDMCAGLGLTFLAWSPLGGISDAGSLGDKHPAFADVARTHGVTPQQVTLAWEIAQSPCVVPIPGASRPQSVAASAAASEVVLAEAELAALDAS